MGLCCSKSEIADDENYDQTRLIELLMDDYTKKFKSEGNPQSEQPLKEQLKNLRKANQDLIRQEAPQTDKAQHFDFRNIHTDNKPRKLNLVKFLSDVLELHQNKKNLNSDVINYDNLYCEFKEEKFYFREHASPPSLLCMYKLYIPSEKKNGLEHLETETDESISDYNLIYSILVMFLLFVFDFSYREIAMLHRQLTLRNTMISAYLNREFKNKFPDDFDFVKLNCFNQFRHSKIPMIIDFLRDYTETSLDYQKLMNPNSEIQPTRRKSSQKKPMDLFRMSIKKKIKEEELKDSENEN